MAGLTVRPELLVCDLDGTLLDAEGHVFPGVAAAVEDLQAVGVRFAVCTGRPYVVARRLLRRAGLHPSLLACCHGALVVDLARRLCLRHLQIPAPAAAAAASLLLKHQVCVTWYAGVWRTELGDGGLVPCGDATRIVACGEVTAVELASLDLRHEGLPGVQVLRASATCLDVLLDEVGKAGALHFLAGLSGIPLGRVVALGDDQSDAPMLRAAGYGVAVGGSDGVLCKAARRSVEARDLAGFLRTLHAE